MAVKYIGNSIYLGLAADTKPTTSDVATNSIFIERDTGVISHYNGTVWTAVAGGGGGSGEANTYSTSGSGAAWTLTKSGVNLPFRSFIVGSNKLQLTTNTDDLTLDVNQGNLSIGWGQLTSVPSEFTPSDHATSHHDGGTDALTLSSIAGTIGDAKISDVAYGKITGAPAVGETNLGANVGTGEGDVFRDKTSATLNFKTIKAGTGVVITNNADDITIDSTGAGGGEANTASNFGAEGTGLWKDKNGVDLRFYKLSTPNNKLSVGLDGTDHIDLTVNDANLSIAWSQLTSVPTEFAPSAHATSHNSGGTDVIHIDTIGSGTDITTNDASTTKHGLLKKLSNVATEYMNGAGNWSTPPDTNEINTYSSSGTGTPIILTKSGVDFPFKAIAAASNKIAIANDAVNNNVTVDVNQTNLSIAWSQVTGAPSTYAPSGHATSHLSNGTDPIAVATTAVRGTVLLASNGGTTAATVVQANDSRLTDSRTPTTHASNHNSGGIDALDLGSLAGVIANSQITSMEYSKLTSVPPNFTPSTHATNHNAAGTDPVHIDTIGAGTDVTTNNASTSKHGLLKKLSNVATEYMDGTGNWSVPAGGGSGEVNTASNVTDGSGIGLYKEKVVADLKFKSLLAGSTKIGISSGTNDISIDVNQANLSIAYSQLTSIPTEIVRTNQANQFGNFAQRFFNNQLKIDTPTGDFSYTFVGQQIVANRNITLPLLTGSDTMVTEDFQQTLTKKRIGTDLDFAPVTQPSAPAATEALLYLDTTDSIMKTLKSSGIPTLIESLDAASGWSRGEMYGEAGTAIGLLSGNSSSGTAAAGNDSTSGFRSYDTSATSNTLAGIRKTNVTRRDQRPIYVFTGDISTTNARLQLGWTDHTGTPAVTDTPIGNSNEGVMLTLRSTDTNYQIVHNDATGAAVFVDTGISKDITIFRTMIWSDGTNFYWWIQKTGGSVAQGTLTTRIPGATTLLAARYNCSNTTAASLLLRIRQALVLQKLWTS